MKLYKLFKRKQISFLTLVFRLANRLENAKLYHIPVYPPTHTFARHTSSKTTNSMTNETKAYLLILTISLTLKGSVVCEYVHSLFVIIIHPLILNPSTVVLILLLILPYVFQL